jgi:Spy/CpxP family protein refolding chaperone
MTTKNRLITGALVAAMAALAGGGMVALADHGPGGERHPRGFGRGGHDFTERLGLSEQQQAQVKAIREKNRDTLKPLFDESRRAHEAFRQALEADNADAATVGQAAIAMKATENKVRAAHKAMFEQIKTVLTPEQLSKLEQDRGRWHGRHHEGPEDEDSEP